MARILYSSQVSDIKGSIGGLTFQRNSSGTICRLKPSRVQSGTSKQNPRLVDFGSASNAWLALDSADREAWQAWADSNPKSTPWGDTKYITGYNYYMSCFCNAMLVDGTPPDVPPASYTPLAIADNAMSIDGSDLKITFVTPFNHTGSYLVVYATPPLQALGLKNRKYLRFMLYLSPDETESIILTSEWLASVGLSAVPTKGTNNYFVQYAISAIDSTSFMSSEWFFSFF